MLCPPRLHFNRPSLGLALALCAAPALAGCGDPTYPTVDCRQAIWALPAREDVEVRVIGSFDDWQTPGTEMESADDGWRVALLDLPPGEYGYQITEGGAPKLDRYQPLGTYRGEQEVSLLTAADCSVPALRVDAASAGADGALTLAGAFVARDGGPALATTSVEVRIDGELAEKGEVQASAATGLFGVSKAGLLPGKHRITIDAHDEDGKPAPTAEASVWVKPAAETWADGVLYQVVVDRYRGDGGAPLAAPATPGSRAGGTLRGVLAEIENGTFEALGVTALWLSPVYTNPEGFLVGRDGRESQGYHGYWPIADREVDPRLGGEEALDLVIAKAHARGIKVLFDLVPNHVHEDNPRYLAHRGDGWFDDGPDHCVCGDPGCDWGTHIQACWFTPFLPDVRWKSEGAVHAAIDDTVFWMRRFDADGVRIDAVPMMPRMATRRILRGMRDSVSPRDALFAVGEVFTGPGGEDVIRYFMGRDGLDSAFDFPLMWALRDAVAHNRSGLEDVEKTLVAGEEALRGSGAVVARMLGNHDTTRFVSEAAGNAGNHPWENPPPQPEGAGVYSRHRLALTVMFALPGLPVLYYGDEVGLAGASDPDSRRVMPDLAAISDEQRATLKLTRRLGALRRCLPALRRGERIPLWADASTWAFARDAGDGAKVLALFSIASAKADIHVPGGVVPAGQYVDALGGQAITLSGGDAITLDPMSGMLLVPENSPCLNESP